MRFEGQGIGVGGGMLEIMTLGGLTIRCRGEAVTGFASRKVEALLVYLACAGRPKAREVLAELLWEERTQSQGLSNLRVALSSLRKQVAPYLLVSREAVGLNPDAEVWLDAAQLEGQLAAVREQKGPVVPGAVAALKRAVALYRGDFLEGFYLRDSAGFESWMVLERERIRAVHEQLAQWLLDALLAGECWHDVVEWGQRWISLGQSPEPAYRAVMQAYGGLGDLPAAQAVYRQCVDALAADLGVEPSVQTRDTYQALLTGRARPRPPAPQPVELQAPAADSSARDLLRRWQGRGREVLDLPSLAVVYASRGDLGIGPDEAGLLIRSALHHGVDVEPWIRRAGSTEAAVQALADTWERYPKPRVRLQIVGALAELPGEEADAALLRMVQAEDAPEIRTEAALAACARDRRDEVVDALLADFGTPRETGAMAALVAVADEYGLPQVRGTGPSPRLPLAAAVARRRWRARHGQVLRQAGRAALGAAFAWALFGLTTPLWVALEDPSGFRTTVQGFVSVPTWMLISAMGAGVVGGILGWVWGAAVGLADAVGQGPRRRRWRLVLGSLAGLAYTLYSVLFTLAGAYSPSAAPHTYLPAYLVYGLLQGLIVPLAIPQLGSVATFGRQLRRSAAVGLANAALAAVYSPVVYPADSAVMLFSRMLSAFLLVAGIGLALISPQQAARPLVVARVVQKGA